MTPVTIGNRKGLAVYMDDQWTPVAAEHASLAKVLFDDGGSAFYRVSQARGAEFNPDQARDEQGRWTDGGADDDRYEEAGATLRGSTARAVESYADFSMQMNDDIRNGKSEKHSAMIASLDKAIAASEATDRDVLLYRGGPRAAYGQFEIGDVFEDKAFVSTSNLRDVGETFVGITGGDDVLVEIKAPKGTRMLDVNSALGTRSPYPDQEERILARGTKFRIAGKTRNSVRVEVVG